MSNHDNLPPLETLDARIAAARQATGPEKAEPSKDGKGVALRSGTELFAGVAVGGFLGYYADDWLGTRPALTIMGIFLGMAGGVMNIYRAVSAETPQADDPVAGAPEKPRHVSED